MTYEKSMEAFEKAVNAFHAALLKSGVTPVQVNAIHRAMDNKDVNNAIKDCMVEVLVK